MIKQRVARSGQGKSGGYRTVIVYRRGDVAFFVYGFPKSDRGNISNTEERALRKLSGVLLGASAVERREMVLTGELMEVIPDER